MKILHAVHGFLPEHDGGTERYVDAVARHQITRGHRVVLAVGSYSDRYDGFVATDRSEGRPTVYRISQLGSYAERWDHGDQPEIEVALARLVTDEAPDVVHVHHWLRLSRGIVRAVGSCGVPVVLTAHDLTPTCPRLFRVRPDEPFCQRPLAVSSCLHCVQRDTWQDDAVVALNLEAYATDMLAETRACTRVIAPSDAHRDVLSRFSNLPPEAITVLPHPRLGAPALSIASKPGENALQVAHWGHLLDYKGPHVLLDALEKLPASISLSLWGRADNATYRARIEASIERLRSRGVRVDRRETFTSDELHDMSADVAVFPSLAHESWSFVVDEALALGIPVVASARGAPPERLGDAGATFTAGDANDLARTLEALATDRSRLEAMRRACASAGMSLDDHAERLEAIYESARTSPASRIPFDYATKIAAARIRRGFEDRARWLDAVKRSAEAELKGTRKDAEDAFRKAAQGDERLQELRDAYERLLRSIGQP
ncbi:MAG: glycosyltransferase [Planctomycetes bacterium]|nr:glycosyltransferase [Planctomycetota bacterium]MCB9891136.1 glycosyltransferase [Planctomycetota bacterium]MCB9918903.1 glycosyltransferase [Planctomycetota bacterium]